LRNVTLVPALLIGTEFSSSVTRSSRLGVSAYAFFPSQRVLQNELLRDAMLPLASSSFAT
jgi:hypothetical protein